MNPVDPCYLFLVIQGLIAINPSDLAWSEVASANSSSRGENRAPNLIVGDFHGDCWCAIICGDGEQTIICVDRQETFKQVSPGHQ